MSITKRLELLLRSEFNALRRGESKEYDRAIKELRKELPTLQKDEARLIDEIRHGRDQAEMWEERATLALSRNEEELARAAIVEQKRILGKVKMLRNELNEIRGYIAKINGDLDSATDQTLSRLTSSPSSSDQSSYSSRRYETSSPQFGTGQAFNEFERIAGNIGQFEANVEAERLLSDNPINDVPEGRYDGTLSSRYPDPLIDPEGVRFESEYRKIINDKEANEGLAALKAKFRNRND